MIEGKDYKAYDTEDITEATENVRKAAKAVAEWLKGQNPGPVGEADAADWLRDIEAVIAAASLTLKALNGANSRYFVTYGKDTTPKRREEIREEAKAAMAAMQGILIAADRLGKGPVQ